MSSGIDRFKEWILLALRRKGLINTISLGLFRVKQQIQKMLGLIGYQIVKKVTYDGPYEHIQLGKKYAPWKEDSSFSEAYEKMRFHSLVDILRCYELWSLVEQSAKLEGALIEVGVYRGGTGALIAERARLCGITDTVYLCDTFKGVVKANAKDSRYVGGEFEDTSRERVEELVKGRFQLDNVRILEGIFPEDTAGLIEDGKFRFCHVDVDVYTSAKDIVEWIWDKLEIGGIIVFDDYGNAGTDGITKYVNEMRQTDGLVITYNLNSQAVMIKTK